MEKFSVYYDPDDLEELCQYTPYNLKKDLKNIGKDTLTDIAEEIANEIHQGLDRPPTAVALRWSKMRQTACAKIRIVDVKRDAGKSHGYRSIVLVDYVHHSAFLLHLYRHGHGENDNISKQDKNALDKLVDMYAQSLEASSKK